MLFQQYSVRFRELPRSARYAAPRVDSVKNAASSGGIFMPKRHKRMPAHLWKTTVGGHVGLFLIDKKQLWIEQFIKHA